MYEGIINSEKTGSGITRRDLLKVSAILGLELVLNPKVVVAGEFTPEKDFSDPQEIFIDFMYQLKSFAQPVIEQQSITGTLNRIDEIEVTIPANMTPAEFSNWLGPIMRGSNNKHLIVTGTMIIQQDRKVMLVKNLETKEEALMKGMDGNPENRFPNDYYTELKLPSFVVTCRRSLLPYDGVHFTMKGKDKQGKPWSLRAIGNALGLTIQKAGYTNTK